jgi:hypothetical protein
VVVAMMLISAAAPPSAQAIKIPNPFDAIAGGIADVAVGAFDAIIRHLFAPITNVVTVELCDALD